MIAARGSAGCAESWCGLLTEENVQILASTLDSMDAKELTEQVASCRPPPMPRTIAVAPLVVAADSAAGAATVVVASSAAGAATVASAGTADSLSTTAVRTVPALGRHHHHFHPLLLVASTNY